MAIEFRFDLVKGNTGKKTDRGWENLIRMVSVRGLDAPNGYDRIHQAVLALFNQEGITIGTPHPAEPTAFLRGITPETLDPRILVLKLEYKVYPFNISNIAVGGSVVQEQTNQELDPTSSVVGVKRDIELSYTYPLNYPEQERAGDTDFTGVIVNQFVGRQIVDINRHEFFALDGLTPITHDILLQRSKVFQGTVNSVDWNVDSEVNNKTKWLCTKLRGVTIDGGFSFNVSYQFVYRNPDWRELVVFIDPNTDKPAKNLILNTSKKQVSLYLGTNFNLLGL